MHACKHVLHACTLGMHELTPELAQFLHMLTSTGIPKLPSGGD
jgi:hypothetical protein